MTNNNELQQARINLNDTENMLKEIAQHRHTKTWTKSIILGYLKYLGYASIAVVSAYLMYKDGLLEAIKICIPRKLCLFCVKTKVETPTYVVTYNASCEI